jgi:hypothetical protein
MKSAAIGVRVHSGWGALVAVAGGRASLEIIERRRAEIIDTKMPGAKQPYHFVRNSELREAEAHLSKCAAISERLARESILGVIGALGERGYQVEAASVLMASGRALPPLPEILASHPMLHTAEGVFFRQAFRKACEEARLRVVVIRERQLDEHSATCFGQNAARVRGEIERAGKALGPPWTSDQKAASLAALLALVEKQEAGEKPSPPPRSRRR